MEKIKKLCIFLIVGLLIFLTVIVLYQVQCRTLLKNIDFNDTLVYMPKGIADEYKSLLSFSVDEHKIWKYDLNVKEEQHINKNLCNGIWNIITLDDKDEAMFFFMYNSVSYWPKDFSSELYYCLYDCNLKKFISLKEGEPILSWRRLLFIYDKQNACYYCVIKSI